MASIEEQDQFIDYTLAKLRGAIKPSVVSLIILVSCSTLGVVFWKSMVVSIAAFIMQISHLGARTVQKVAIALLFITGLYWIDIAPIERWGTMLGAKIERELQR